MTSGESKQEWVGPVLKGGPLTQAARAAILELNPQAQFHDHGSYVRVLAPEPCRLTRQALIRHAGTELSLPVAVESIMTAFKGRFSISEDEARWESFRSGGRS